MPISLFIRRLEPFAVGFSRTLKHFGLKPIFFHLIYPLAEANGNVLEHLKHPLRINPDVFIHENLLINYGCKLMPLAIFSQHLKRSLSSYLF